MNIGYIGIGIMGEPMARNLLKAGHALYIYNRTAGKCAGLAVEGAMVCQNAAAVAGQVQVVFINVPDSPDVEQVIFGAGGIAESAGEGLIVIDNSTISAAATRQFAQWLKPKGVEYLDAPVSGGDIGAQQGTLAIMVGGEKAIFDQCLSLLEVLGSQVVHVGAAGMGQICKACNQLCGALHMLACCEGIRLAQKAGLDPQKMVQVVSAGASGSWVLDNLASKILAGDMEPGFMIDLLVKDLGLVMELAGQNHIPLPGTALARQYFEQAQKQGLGRKGTQVLFEVIDKMRDNANGALKTT